MTLIDDALRARKSKEQSLRREEDGTRVAGKSRSSSAPAGTNEPRPAGTGRAEAAASAGKEKEKREVAGLFAADPSFLRRLGLQAGFGAVTALALGGILYFSLGSRGRGPAPEQLLAAVEEPLSRPLGRTQIFEKSPQVRAPEPAAAVKKTALRTAEEKPGTAEEESGSLSRSRTETQGGRMALVAMTVQDQVNGLGVRGVQVGTYEARAVIDGKVVRQGERFSSGGRQLTFKGVRDRDLLFEDDEGTTYQRPLRPLAADLPPLR
jgi:hypothetical protein